VHEHVDELEHLVAEFAVELELLFELVAVFQLIEFVELLELLELVVVAFVLVVDAWLVELERGLARPVAATARLAVVEHGHAEQHGVVAERAHGNAGNELTVEQFGHEGQ
jgi:hypothetical protein